MKGSQATDIVLEAHTISSQLYLTDNIQDIFNIENVFLNLEKERGFSFTYTTPSTVRDVSAILVATIMRLQFGGAGVNTRTYLLIASIQLIHVSINLVIGSKHAIDPS